MKNDHLKTIVSIALLVAILALAYCAAQNKADEIAACESPEFIQAVPDLSGQDGYFRTSTTYLYRCADGHVIETGWLLR